MKKVVIGLILFILFIICIEISRNFFIKDIDNVAKENVIEEEEKIDNMSNTFELKYEDTVSGYVGEVFINNNKYNVKFEENETAEYLLDMLPQNFNMSDLHGNEKYVYLEDVFPTDSYNPNYINAGDVMLYGNNCLVVFYKSFDTSYSYTKIGHIDNLPDLGNGDITIKFEK